jgi:hypothetical protein
LAYPPEKGDIGAERHLTRPLPNLRDKGFLNYPEEMGMEWGAFAPDAAAVAAILTAVTALLHELRKWRRPPTDVGKKDIDPLAPLTGRKTNCPISLPAVDARLSRPEPPRPSPSHTKPSTSWKHELPKFRPCQWSSTAGGGARIGRRETPISRRPMRTPLTGSKLRKQEASIGRMLRIRLESSTALPAELGARPGRV